MHRAADYNTGCLTVAVFPTLDNQAKHLVEQDDAQTGKAAQNLHLLKLLSMLAPHTDTHTLTAL